MKPLVTMSTIATLAMPFAILLAQAPTGGNPAPARRPFEIFRVEGQPVDRRPPQLDTDHPVFPGQTHAPFHQTVDVNVTTIASGLDTPWAVALLPSGRFLITEKPGRIRILNKDGSPFHTIVENLPPIYVRGQAGLLDVALDQNYSRNHRIFFAYTRNIDAENCGLAVDSAVLDESPFFQAVDDFAKRRGRAAFLGTTFQVAPWSFAVETGDKPGQHQRTAFAREKHDFVEIPPHLPATAIGRRDQNAASQSGAGLGVPGGQIAHLNTSMSIAKPTPAPIRIPTIA